MSSFFSYDVLLCMNITDVDDKIITKANANGVPFDVVSREQEASFLEDMKKLGVAPPDVMTRVSEYVPSIVGFIQKIIDRGFAYESSGSVYFDTEKYKNTDASAHVYGKLMPENVENAEGAQQLLEAEGSLSAGASDKRSPSDFALWKASKPNEPNWPSVWGPGRPGWHIECSAMCDDTLGGYAGGRIDIHSGGIDLRFPHHENEIAQSEACLGCAQWTNYFVHSGHLHIEGLKMSKSLKNFVTINDAVSRYGARALRLLFLRVKYNAEMHYSAAAMETIAAEENKLVSFFQTAQARLRALSATLNQAWGDADKAFAELLQATKVSVRAALADDFDTPEAMRALMAFIGETNKYMSGAAPVPLLVRSAANYVTDIFRVFGLVDALPSVGFEAAGDGTANKDRAQLEAVLDSLAGFRERVRDAARSKDFGRVLSECDELRDKVLPPLGIKLEDVMSSSGARPATPYGPASSQWKRQSAEDFQREQEENARKVADAAARKAKAAEADAKKAAEKEARLKKNPDTMFREDAEYTGFLFDDEGIPSHDRDGVELSKSKLKNLRKERDDQRNFIAKATSAAGGAAASARVPASDGGVAAAPGQI